MEISVTLFGGLRHFLPAGSSFNKCKISIDDGDSLEALLQRIPIPADKPYLIILNDEKVLREAYAETIIQTDDDIVLLPPIKGG
jgi:sulfur carrier protein ThiS